MSRAGSEIGERGSGALAPAKWRAVDALGITRLTNDSRAVKTGDTFVAYPGESRDGRDYIAQAIANGAAGVLWERAGFEWNPQWRTPNLGLRQLRRHAGAIASRVYNEPSRRLHVVGVTGTNGKTTCSQWIAQALSRAGRRCAVIGTLGHGLRAPLAPLANTTPDALWLHAQLAEFARRGARAVAMEVSSIGLDQDRVAGVEFAPRCSPTLAKEVSSIGLDQDRVAGVEFDVALFTNLTRDHLEYHRTMRRYREAKAKLFAWETLRHAVVNLDDEFGVELARRCRRPGLKVIGYGFGVVRGAVRGPRVARVTGSNLVTGASGASFDVTTPWGAARVTSTALGRHNASNLLGTLAVLLASGIALKKAVAALSGLAPVPGRLQRFGGGRRPLVVVDYAHTPDALKHALTTLRDVLASRQSSAASRQSSRLFCVFGCGGDRDRGKRPLMGRVAAQLADRAIVTSDNPRSEDPHEIIADIMSGVRRGEVRVNADRRDAILRAVAEARGGDIVLVAGKGHEAYQEIRGVRHAFSDGQVAEEALAQR